MKIKFTLLLLFFVGSLQYVSAYQSINWEFINSFSDVLTNVYTLGKDTVYVVGQNGLIAQSPDRGKTWNYQHITNNTLNDIYFVSHDTGFVVGSSGVILKTNNAGISWETINSGTTQNLNAISGTDITNIWAVGTNGIVIKSSDEGETWNIVTITNNSPYFTDIGFNNDKGYIIGTGGNIFQALNNETSWTKQVITGYVEGYGYFRFLSLTEHNIYMYESYDGNLCVNTHNNWETTKLPQQDIHGSIDAIFFVNDSTGYLITQNTTSGEDSSTLMIYKTSDGGNGWIYSDEIPSQSYNPAISLKNDTLGYIISGHNIFRTPYVGDINAGISQLDQNISLSQSNNLLNINSPYKTISNIKIIAISGQIMFQENMNNENKIILDIENLNNGVYVIQIYFSNNTQSSLKWIKH